MGSFSGFRATLLGCLFVPTAIELLNVSTLKPIDAGAINSDRATRSSLTAEVQTRASKFVLVCKKVAWPATPFQFDQ